MARCRTCTVYVRGRVYCAEHSPLKDPVWRRQRAKKAAALNHARHQAHLRDVFGGMTNVEAGAYGYRVGYRRAYHWWKRQFARLTAA